MDCKIQYLQPGSAQLNGPQDRYVRFTLKHQLLNPGTWESFVRVFREDSDDDLAWRGEYWGKMMRGACLIYRYAPEEGLYALLETAVTGLLDAQRPDGRISTYSSEAQLQGWDVWCRKYVLTGMLHFYDICRDEALKSRIITSMCTHVDALMAMVGAEDGKKPITETSNYWGGMNSCSILDGVIALYRITEKPEYRDFAQYIISTGGCSNGDLMETALENKLLPYEYPQVKAYEMMSFFEGLLSWYELTGEPEYLRAVTNFVEAVYASDVTVIGCSGCTHELFDHSLVRQVLPSDNIMQETCVTVTWMRLLARLYRLCGEEKYIARIEHSGYNALYGSTNEYGLPQRDLFNDILIDGMPFDSYAPLYNQARGLGTGGLQHFAFGGHYGCCACIASAGIALMPLCSVMKDADGLIVNSFTGGTVRETLPEGGVITLSMESPFPSGGSWKCTLETDAAQPFALKLRIPDYCEATRLLLNGQPVALPDSGYLTLQRVWKSGDTLEFSSTWALKTLEIGGRTAFTCGPLTLARDAEKENGADLEENLTLALKDGKLSWRMAEPVREYNEALRIYVSLRNGNELLLTDFASCGKRWNSRHNRMTVWMNISI